MKSRFNNNLLQRGIKSYIRYRRFVMKEHFKIATNTKFQNDVWDYQSAKSND